MAKYTAIFTTYGTQVLAKAIANNQPLRVTHFAIGDGNGKEVTVSASQERLVNEKHRAAISAVSLDPRNNKQVIFELTIPENVGGFYIREMGVFDANNKLVAYANCPESFKPTLASGSGKVQVMRMILLVASSNAVTLTVDDSVIFVTRGQLTPHTITATSSNGFDQNGHSHEIDKASTTKSGIVQLTNDTGLDSENLGLTAKAGKKLAQLIATVQLALNNYIPNSKKSSAVNSNSTDTVANSAAVKTAYDKGVEAKQAADGAQRTANDGVAKANAAQNSADNAQNTANDGVRKANAAQNAADNAQQSAETANTNANTRVAKSGDTMTGSLTIARASKFYKVGSYSWDKFIDLSSDAVIGNDKCVIGFNNNGALHLGGKPNADEFNASIDESMLWVRGDVQTKTGKSLNKSVSIDDFTTIKAGTGWTKLPTGLIIQWGQFLPSNLINNETGSTTFPQRYPHSVFCVICGSVGGSSGNGTEGFAVISQDNSKFNWKSYWEGRHKRDFPEKIQWIAIGY